jgi:hypothetical protein
LWLVAAIPLGHLTVAVAVVAEEEFAKAQLVLRLQSTL